MPFKVFPPQKERLTLAQLTSYDDILTDALVDHVYYWTTIRKNRNMYHASRGIREEDVTSVIQQSIIIEKNASKAESQVLALPGIRKFIDGLKSEKEKEDFRRHLRRYINIYLPDCPFEISSTNRYTLVTHEAAITARTFIKKGETVKYLCGIQVIMTPDEEADIALRKRDFSIVISSRNKSASLFLGPARFANHDCGANARLMTSGAVGMEIIAVKDIDIGDEITVTYGDNYFGEDNCECLCKTCEDRHENGWEQEGENVVDPAPTLSIEQEPGSRGAYSFRRKRKYDSIDSSRTPSATPDIRPRVPKLTPKHLISFRKHLSSPAKSSGSCSASETPLPQKRELRQLLADMTPTHKKARVALRTQEEKSSRSRTLCSTPASSRNSSVFDSRGSASPEASSLASNTQTDATSVDDDTTIGRRKRKASDIKGSADQSVMGQVHSVDTIIAGPSTDEKNAIVETEVKYPTESQSDHDASFTTIAQTKEARKLKRPSSKLLGRPVTKRKKYNKKGPAPLSATDVDQAPKIRSPGDYELTPLLLAQPASAWISCKICDGFFVQLDAYFTRSSCPRCERHSKLYGYQWPKTEKEGKHDPEERVTDHRTVHRFIRPDEEKAVRKRDRRQSTSGSVTRDASEVTTPSTLGGRKSGRIRTMGERFSL